MASFKWSTPERRVGQKRLPLISNEIYLDIFDYIQSTEDMNATERKDTLSNLALVCRFFCAVALPIIFRSVTFSPESEKGSGHTFCRELVRNQEPARSLALYVKTCSFHQWDTDGPSPILRPITGTFLGFYIRAATRFDNLGKLSLYETPVNRNLIALIGGLQKLKSLSIVECTIGGVIVEDFPAHLSALQLVTFECRLSWPEPLLAALVDVTDTPSLRVLRTESTLARLFMNSGTNLALEELSISALAERDTSILRNFLSRTPSITTLVLSSTPCHLELPRSALPNLRTLRCQPCLGHELIPHRPLGDIYLVRDYANACQHSSRSSDNEVPLLAQSTGIVHTLQLPAYIYLSLSLGEHFPQLHTLYLDFFGVTYPPPLRDLLSQLSMQRAKTPSIGELEFTFPTRVPDVLLWDLDLKEQHTAVTLVLTAIFPTVLRVRIFWPVEWRRHNDRAKEWQPFIPGSYRHSVKSIIRATGNLPGNRTIRDFGGCLSGLFETSETDRLICP